MNQTARFYNFENCYLNGLRKWPDTPMRVLRSLALRVARDHHRSPPVVVAGRGLWDGRSLASHNTGDRIVLKRNHRTVLVTLHEVAHHIQGYRGQAHGPAFVNHYFDLLARYAGLNRQEIQYAAREWGIKS